LLNLISCLPTRHDPYYTATAVLVALFGATLAANLFDKAARNSGSKKLTLSIMTGIIGGSSIWTTHFVAILGMHLEFSHSYGMNATLVSLLISITISSLGFYIASLDRTLALRAAGGAILGMGIGAMHFSGVFALEFSGAKTFDLPTVAMAAAAGISLSVISMTWSVFFPRRHPKTISALLFVLAIGALHYLGMCSLTITPEAASEAVDNLSDANLFVAVMFMSGLMMLFGAAAYALDTQNANERLGELEFRAFHDPLSGLPNRAMLEDKLRTVMGSQRARGSMAAIVNFDLDRFKDINDTHGHGAGDHVLRGISERLSAAMGRDEFVCRVGGDEFIALKPSISSREQAVEFATRMQEAVKAPIGWKDKTLSVGSSAGIACYPTDGTESADLLVKADLAMYRAKRGRLSTPVFYESQIDDANRDRSALSIDLRQALERDEFELFYQRQNDIADGTLIGYEVLLRWCHADRGFISPNVFIPIAERDGIIDEIGEWVIRKACMEAAAWTSPMKIAVNVAARQLANDSLPGIVRSALAESGLDSSKLEIEITESGIIADADQAFKIIGELKEIGVSIAMDDYGTGYSSLSTLQSFPFDKIKIDKGFIKDVATSEQSQAIVKSTIQLGRLLKIAVLAEGVETLADLNFLRTEGCAQVQGFLFGRPMPSNMIASA
jgi:diguanylate cyclase (GGDEF)-like protein